MPWATTRGCQARRVNVTRMLISIYTLSGLICALAGWTLIGRIARLPRQRGSLRIFESITAGGDRRISLFGGRVHHGHALRALIVGVFSLGLRFNGHRPAMDLSPDRLADHHRRCNRPVDQKVGSLMHRNPFSNRPCLGQALWPRDCPRSRRLRPLSGEILAVIGDNGAGKSR